MKKEDEDIREKLASLVGTGDRISKISMKITKVSTDIEYLAKEFERLNKMNSIRRIKVNFYSESAYERPTVSIPWRWELEEIKEILKKKIHQSIGEMLNEIEELKKEI